MRLLLVTMLALCLSTSTGCMVLDEIDSANAKMKSKARNAGKKGAAAPQPGSGNADAAALEKARALLEPSLEWWEGASSFSAQEVDASVVRCDLPGGTQFMSRDDCRARGGSPGGV